VGCKMIVRSMGGGAVPAWRRRLSLGRCSIPGLLHTVLVHCSAWVVFRLWLFSAKQQEDNSAAPPASSPPGRAILGRHGTFFVRQSLALCHPATRQSCGYPTTSSSRSLSCAGTDNQLYHARNGPRYIAER
jgi:hypothetical protein